MTNSMNFQSDYLNLLPALTGIIASVALFGASITLWLHKKAMDPFQEITKLAHRPRLELFLLSLIVGGFVQYGATKGTNGSGRDAVGLPMPSGQTVTPSAIDSEGISVPTKSFPVTNLCFWSIAKNEGLLSLGVAWPESAKFENDLIDLYGHWELSSNGWFRLVQVDVSGAKSNIVIEINADNFPTDEMNERAFFRLASQDDADGDGLSDKYEEWCTGTNPNLKDSDGDLIEDGEEIARGMNPHSVDTDGDGLSDMEELCMYETNPLETDTDGDGLPDGWEIAQGLDPLNALGLDGADGDPYFEGITNMDRYLGRNRIHTMTRTSSETETDYVSSGASWFTVTGDLSAGVAKTQTGTLIIPKGTKAFVGVFLHSEEYPHYTGSASQYNDTLSWSISAFGNAPITGNTRVNDENGDWSAAEDKGQYIESWKPVVFQSGAIYSASTNSDLQVNVTISATNVSDGALPSTVIVGLFPLENVQSNWPVGTGVGRVADSGNVVSKRLVENGMGYINATPARPIIQSKFADLPEWIDVGWSASLTKERSERPASDNRTVATKSLSGNQAFDLFNEIGDTIGGSVAVTFNIAGRFSGTTTYKVRGKNPRDTVARAYIDSNVPAATSEYAWKIAVHESRQGARIYNQFNSGGASAELPNKGSGFGWGIAQIDNHTGNVDQTPFEQVWDWHENIAAMNAKLIYALERTNVFIGYYREAYGSLPNWTEPPSITVIGETVSAEMWSVLTIYNGVGGVPPQTAGGHSGFRSPLEFNPRTGRWIFHSNTTNPDYVRRVVGAGMIPNIRE